MARRQRRNHSSVFKAKVALAALKGDKTIAKLAEQFAVYSNQITDWKRQLKENDATVFGERQEIEKEPDIQKEGKAAKFSLDPCILAFEFPIKQATPKIFRVIQLP